MMFFKRFLSLVIVLFLFCPAAMAATTPTPAPLELPTDVIQDIPETIQNLLDLAYQEWQDVNGAELNELNKYTKWRNNYKYGWCGGFITWLMLEMGIPQETWQKTPKKQVEGIVHVKEAGVGKLVTGYSRMSRTTMVPQKGFIVVYGSKNKKHNTPLYHVGLVYDVKLLENGKYRLTTLEGNVNYKDKENKKNNIGHTVRMYVRDYDMYVKKADNLTQVPEDERTEQESVLFSYDFTYNDATLYVHMFLTPWIPE